jgi:hypothetical protein
MPSAPTTCLSSFSVVKECTSLAVGRTVPVSRFLCVTLFYVSLIRKALMAPYLPRDGHTGSPYRRVVAVRNGPHHLTRWVVLCSSQPVFCVLIATGKL